MKNEIENDPCIICGAYGAHDIRCTVKPERSKGRWSVSEAVSTDANALTIVDGDGIYVAEMFCLGERTCQAEPKEAKANAEFIVNACNDYQHLHDELNNQISIRLELLEALQNIQKIAIGFNNDKLSLHQRNSIALIFQNTQNGIKKVEG